MACELTAWMQILVMDGPAVTRPAWEPKRLRPVLRRSPGDPRRVHGAGRFKGPE